MKKFLALVFVYVLLISPAYASVAIDALNFPDAIFRNSVTQFDRDNNGTLSDSELELVDTINVAGTGVKSLQGIEYFTSLKTLYCDRNNLEVLNLSSNINLETLSCYENSIASLDISKQKDLLRLWCWNNKLTNLNLSENLNLRSLRADNNLLNDIDLTNQLKLSELSLKGNNITKSGVIKSIASFTQEGNFVTFNDVSDYANIPINSIKGYASDGTLLNLLSFMNGTATFASRPEIVSYEYQTGIESLRLKSAMTSGNIENLIMTDNGLFSGVTDHEVTSWKGIPYAKAPVGTLRWKAPEALNESTEFFAADKFAPAALQPQSIFTPSSVTGDMNEDCLYLNIWNADNDSDELKPVVVWIHGGAFQAGATSNAYYQGDKFARDNPDIIFVSVGYRLGLMGFIDFSEVSGGENYPDSGNLGLLDMMQALRWLNKNISSFGGDRNRITLMGQSAGAACISMLMTIPESKTLFKRAILESGAVSMHTRKADALPLAQLLLSVTGKTDMAGLVSLTQDELLNAIETLRYSTNFPEIDERILSKDLYSAFAKNAGDFDLLIGTNADELNYWLLALGQESFDLLVSAGFQMTEYAIGQYSSDDVVTAETFAAVTSNDYPEFFNEICFRGPAIQLAQSHTGNTYMYYWEYPIQLMDVGATHEAELAYFIDNPALVNILVPQPNTELQARVQSMVSSFIRTGNPSTGSVTWPQYDSNTRATMIFNDTGNTGIDYDPLSIERELISPLLKWGISGRELVNGDLSSGISVDPDAATKPEPEPYPYPEPQPEPEPEPYPYPEPQPEPEPEPSPAPYPDPESGDPESKDVKPKTIGRSGGGCDFGMSFTGSCALLMLLLMKKKKNDA